MKFNEEGIKNITFPSGAMGYKKKDVDDFLTYVAKDYGSYKRQLDRSKQETEAVEKEKLELLKQMEKNGLVRRESLDSDRRMKKIILTEKALEYQEQVKDGLMELEEDLVKGIPEEKLEIFLEVINRMINNLSD